MFVYNGEKHGLRERDNQKHWTIHQDEFFDHYLKGAPRPEWMDKGVPYLEKGKRDVTGFYRGGERVAGSWQLAAGSWRRAVGRRAEGSGSWQDRATGSRPGGGARPRCQSFMLLRQGRVGCGDPACRIPVNPKGSLGVHRSVLFSFSQYSLQAGLAHVLLSACRLISSPCSGGLLQVTFIRRRRHRDAVFPWATRRRGLHRRRRSAAIQPGLSGSTSANCGGGSAAGQPRGRGVRARPCRT